MKDYIIAFVFGLILGIVFTIIGFRISQSSEKINQSDYTITLKLELPNE